MVRLLAFLIITMCFMILFSSRWIWSIQRARRNGLYPDQNNPTLFEVRELIIHGEKEMAIQLYCDIFKTNRKTATQAVNELEQSIQGHNSEME